MGGHDITYNQYDFAGNITRSLIEHTTSYNVSSSVTELYTYTYDHAGRLIDTKYELNDEDEILLTRNKYDELGRLIGKTRHNSKDKEEFDYNIRNWATRIKSGDFEEKLFYNSDLPSIGHAIYPYYNGNIRMITWTYNGEEKNNLYDYDGLNRLTESYNHSNGYLWNNLSELFSYDKNGNIKQLIRRSDKHVVLSEHEQYYELYDNLVMTHDGNRLLKIEDKMVESESEGLYHVKQYNDINTAGNDFAYDANGNMIKDLDRDIVTIRYNLLNLPDTIQFRNGSQIVNLYAADGRKLRTRSHAPITAMLGPITVSAGQVIDCHKEYPYYFLENEATSYVNTKEYILTTPRYDLFSLKRVHNSEGYMNKEYQMHEGFARETSRSFNYYRRDHLGNNREVWQAPPTGGGGAGITIQRTQYYPSGLPLPYQDGDGADVQPYKFGGKEFIETHGLDEYDFHARGYYPAVMRFNTVDPLAEKYYWISPYAYCANNPIRYIDPDGRFIATAIGTIVGSAAGAYKAYKSGTDMWAGAAEGAIAGAITGAVIDGTVALTVATGGGALVVIGAGVAAGAVGGAAGGVAGDIAGQVVTATNKGQSLSESASNISTENFASKATSGAVTGAVSGVTGGAVGAIGKAAATSTKAVQATMSNNITTTATTLTTQGASQGTVNAAVNSVTKGMSTAGSNTVNTMIKMEAAAATATETTIKVAEEQLRKNGN